MYYINKTDASTLNQPQHVELPEPVKRVAVSQTHMFAVTLSNKVYSWMQYNDKVKPFLVKGLFNDSERYDEDGNLLKHESKEKTEDEKAQEEIYKPANYKSHEEVTKEQLKIDETKKITKIVCGNVFALILYDSGQLFYCPIKEDSAETLICRPVKGLHGKRIVDIEASFAHCIAFEKTVIPPIMDWDSTKVSQWFEEIGLHE